MKVMNVKLAGGFVLFFCFPLYAEMEQGTIDKTTLAITSQVDKHVIIDDKGNLKQSESFPSVEGNSSDAMSSVNRLFSQFDQTMKKTDDLDKKLQKNVAAK